MDYTVFEAFDDQSAIDRCKAKEFNLVLVDGWCADANRYRLIDALRCINPFTPVIVAADSECWPSPRWWCCSGTGGRLLCGA